MSPLEVIVIHYKPLAQQIIVTAASHKTRHVEPMLVQCLADTVSGRPTLV